MVKPPLKPFALGIALCVGVSAVVAALKPTEAIDEHVTCAPPPLYLIHQHGEPVSINGAVPGHALAPPLLEGVPTPDGRGVSILVDSER